MNGQTSPATVENRSAVAQLSPAGILYVVSVGVAGTLVVIFSLGELYDKGVWLRWLPLAALTLLSGSATVKLPSVPATISVSETFVFTSVLLFGPAAGAVIDALDGLIISLWLGKGRKEWYRVVFNMAAPAVSIWCAAHVYFAFPGVHPLIEGAIPIERLIVPLAVFALAHFLLNTWLVVIAVSFQLKRPAFQLWRRDFLWLSLNYFGGASVSALLAVYTRDVSPAFLGVIVPLLLVLYFTFKIPMARVEDSYRHVQQVNSLYISTIETLAMAIDAKDQVTHGHIRRVQSYAVGLAKALGIQDGGLLKAIEASALLHDLGKLKVPEYILNKPGKLTPAEFEKMKLHASNGAELLSTIEFPYPVVPIVRHHHENWNGTGYPDGLTGTDIPIGARILSVVDCYDALTSDRPYRPKMSHEQATSILLQRRGTMYDPLIVDTFIRVCPHLSPAESSSSVLSEGTDTINDVRTRAEQIAGRPHNLPINGNLSDLSGCDGTGARGEDWRRRQELCTALCQQSGASVGVIALYDELRDDLVVRHVYGSAMATLVDCRIPLGHRLIGWAGATRQTLVNSDPSLDFAGFAIDTPKDVQASLVIPLSLNDTLVAVLALYSRHAFSPESRQQIEAAAQVLLTPAPSHLHVRTG